MAAASIPWHTISLSIEMARTPKDKTVRLGEAIGSWTPLLAGLSMAGFLVLPGSGADAADNGQDAQIAAMCASCHGPGGSEQGIPVIAGLEEQKIVTALHAYRIGERPSQVMHAVALSLSDEELASVARYLAADGKAGSPP